MPRMYALQHHSAHKRAVRDGITKLHATPRRIGDDVSKLPGRIALPFFRLAFVAIALFSTLLSSPALGLPVPPLRSSALPRAPWLVVSDVHFDPYLGGGEPSKLSFDTNGALLDSLLAELKHADPGAPVIIIAGDFLAHHFRKSAATATMTDLARRFNRAFPNAQFVLALGNNDSDCGDYAIPLGGAFLRAVATAWEPLVNRHGAAPNFSASFARDGGYTATLPARGLRAVVLNDIYAAVRYRDACGPHENAAATSFTRLTRTLASGPKNERTWLVTHIPPGIDAFSTAHLAHRLLVVPFLRSGARERLVDLINDPANRVALVIVGHTHKFAYRLSNENARTSVPILLAPSVSPIFLNAPSFLTVEVDGSGTVGNVAETSYLGRRWRRIGDLASLGAPAFDVAALARVQRRLANEPALRERFATLYSGGGVSDINANNWRVYWCAATELSAGNFRSCASEGGYGVFTGRALRLAAVAAALALALAAAAFVLWHRLRVSRRVRGGA